MANQVIASGVVATDDILSNEKVIDMQNEFRLLDVDDAQFMTILNKFPSQPAIREKVEWIEDSYFPNLSTLANSATSAATTLDVTAGQGDYFRAGDLVRLSTAGEVVEVSSVSTDALTVTRSIGSIAAASAASGEELLIIGNVAAQGADYGTLKVNQRVAAYNYTQIVRNSFGFTGTQAEIETYGPGDPANEIAKKAVEHKRALENLFLMGGRAYDSTANKGWVGGIVHEFISTNVTAVNGALSLTALDGAMTDILQFGTQHKVVFAAPTAAQALSKLMNDDWVQAPPGTEVYGVKVNAFISGAYGVNIPVITKRNWGLESTSGLGRGGWMLVLDMAYIKKRPLRNRNTMLLKNRQGNGIDGVVHEFLTEASIEVAVEKAHGLLKGISS